jgi:hypothetical protein
MATRTPKYHCLRTRIYATPRHFAAFQIVANFAKGVGHQAYILVAPKRYNIKSRVFPNGKDRIITRAQAIGVTPKIPFIGELRLFAHPSARKRKLPLHLRITDRPRPGPTT